MDAPADTFERLYPFRSQFFETGAGRMHYVDEGDRQAPVLLMVHGNPTWSFYYRSLILALRTTHRIIAPDHLGCGLSDKPQDWRYRLRDHIDNLAALVRHLQLGDITLAVHDWGGAIGMGVAVEQPERFSRFVIFNTAAFQSPKMPPAIALARIPGFSELAIRGFNAFAAAAIRTCVVHKERITRGVKAGYLKPYDSWKNRIATHRFVADIPMSASHPSHAVLAGIEARLPLFVEHPMLIAWGAKDFVFDDWFFDQWKQRFPKAVAKRIEDAGHYVVEDAHERIVPWMRALLGGGEP
jgi:cis-3-alkyl-4-acyloxetan-2-one decarboxylase